MTTENELGRPYETCWRCGKESPPHIEGPEGAAAQGWVSVEEGDEDDIGVYCPDCYGIEMGGAVPNVPPA